MITLTEYLQKYLQHVSTSELSGMNLLVCPAADGYDTHIFTYTNIKLSRDRRLCDVGSHPCWRPEFSIYTATWVPTDEVLVVEG